MHPPCGSHRTARGGTPNGCGGPKPLPEPLTRPRGHRLAGAAVDPGAPGARGAASTVARPVRLRAAEPGGGPESHGGTELPAGRQGLAARRFEAFEALLSCCEAGFRWISRPFGGIRSRENAMTPVCELRDTAADAGSGATGWVRRLSVAMILWI